MRFRFVLTMVCLLMPLAATAATVEETEGAEGPAQVIPGEELAPSPVAPSAPLAPAAPKEKTEPNPPAAQPSAAVPATPPTTQTPASPQPDLHQGSIDFDTVVLQGLNKVTANAQTIEAPIGSVVRFGTIEIVAHHCWQAAPDASPENAALLEISEIKQGEPPARIFLGWMFSSNPGLSSLEHAFYDITVVGCTKTAEEEKAPPAKTPPVKVPVAKTPAAKPKTPMAAKP